MTIDASGILAGNTNLHYLRALLFGQELRQFDTLCDQVGNTTMEHLNQLILDLGMYFSPVNQFSKQKHAMRHGISNQRELKVRC